MFAAKQFLVYFVEQGIIYLGFSCKVYITH